MKAKLPLIACITLFSIACKKSDPNPPPPPQPWEKTFGGTMTDRMHSFVTTSDGGYLMVGSTTSDDRDVTINKGHEDMWVVRLDKGRNIVWNKSYGGFQYEHADAVVSTPDGGFIIAGTTNSSDGDIPTGKGDLDLFVMKLTPAGEITWRKTYGGSLSETANALLVNPDGNCIVVAQTSSFDGDLLDDDNEDRGEYDIWLLQLNGATGAIMKQNTMGGTGNDIAKSIVPGSSNSYYITGTRGSSDGTFSDAVGGTGFVLMIGHDLEVFGGSMLGGDNQTNMNEIIKTADGGFIVVGTSSSTDIPSNSAKGGLDAYIVKLDAAGAISWQKILGGSSTDYAWSVAQKENGNYILAGSTYSNSTGDVPVTKGEEDIWLSELNGSGQVVKAKAFGGGGAERSCKVLIDSDEGYVIGGTTNSNNGDVSVLRGGGSDFWLMKVINL